MPTHMPIAHSANPEGEPQGLVEHLRNVAALASCFAAPFGGSEIAYWAGLWHDLGKFHPAWQEFIAAPEGRRGPDHSSAGAVYAAARLPPLSGLIGGHHGGLPDRQDLRERLERMAASDSSRAAIDEAARHLERLEPADSRAVPLPSWLTLDRMTRGGEAEADRHRWELFLRLLFSALVDADFLDTEEHFDATRPELRLGGPPIDELWRRFVRSHQAHTVNAEPNLLNRLRAEIYGHCLAAAEAEPGLFRLTVPTGGGKTLSGMGFALRHALAHDLRRIVVAIPFTSIIEQTADTYLQVFGDGVLEHHSAVAPLEHEATEAVRREDVWRRLASENWDAPIVVTTTVQLFESLFSNRPGACRKLHNLAGSVIILDEVQTLPFELLAPILDALRELTENYRVSVVFCTATQPAVTLPPYSEVFQAARPIVPEPERYFQALRRVTYEVPSDPWPWARVADEMKTSPQSLVVVNTKKDAHALLEALDDPRALHLSTNLCGAHRRKVLSEVRERLRDDAPCRLVSTQVVEAGVDLDFPLVLRAIGPLDRIVQAAGRCNREGGLGRAGGRVVVFDPSEGSSPPPGVYKSGIDTARRVLAQGGDLHDPATYETYFRSLSQGVNLDRKEIQPERAGWNFATVAERFRLIDDDSLPVLVPYPSRNEMDARLAATTSGGANPRALFRTLQPYLVTVRRRVATRYAAQGLLEEVLPGLWHWLGDYEPVAGLVERTELTPEELVV